MQMNANNFNKLIIVVNSYFNGEKYREPAEHFRAMSTWFNTDFYFFI